MSSARIFRFARTSPYAIVGGFLSDAIPICFFFFSSRRRHTRSTRDWSSDVCSSDLGAQPALYLLLSVGPAPQTEEGKGQVAPLSRAVENLPVTQLAAAAQRDRAGADPTDRKSVV